MLCVCGRHSVWRWVETFFFKIEGLSVACCHLEARPIQVATKIVLSSGESHRKKKHDCCPFLWWAVCVEATRTKR